MYRFSYKLFLFFLLNSRILIDFGNQEFYTLHPLLLYHKNKFLNEFLFLIK